MSNAIPEAVLGFIDVGEGPSARRIAVRSRAGRGPGLVWLGGFKSDMRGSKAVALDAWAADHGRAAVRFDIPAMANPAASSPMEPSEAGSRTAWRCSSGSATARRS